MSDAGLVPTAFTMIGDQDAAACVGDVCAVPEQAAPREHAIVAARLDDDAV